MPTGLQSRAANREKRKEKILEKYLACIQMRLSPGNYKLIPIQFT
jgi:hypothetical protein